MKVNQPRTLLAALLMLALTGCAHTNGRDNTTLDNREASLPQGVCGESLDKSQRISFTMAQQAFQKGEYFSSLAMLEQLDDRLITKQALQASAYRKTAQWDEAKALYHDLLSSCVKGNAEHGLGLVAAYQGDVEQAKQWLSQAVKDEPANANIHNDYGFLLLSMGDIPAARQQLLTALELAPKSEVTAKNLWLLLVRNNEGSTALDLQQRFGWKKDEVEKLLYAAQHFYPLGSAAPQSVPQSAPESLSALIDTDVGTDVGTNIETNVETDVGTDVDSATDAPAAPNGERL